MPSFKGVEFGIRPYTGKVDREDRLVLLSMAAEDLGYSSERLRQLLKAGVVEGTRRGKLWFLRESEVETLRGHLRKANRKPT